MNDLTVCGGWDANDEAVGFCMTLGPKGWETTHNLSQARDSHVSWRRDNGILLMGGDSSETYNTTEVAGQDGSVVDGLFRLQYEIT